MKKLLIGLTVIVALLVLFLMMGPFYIIDEGSQAVVTRFGKIVDSHTDAGLYFKMPFVDQVTLYPKRILSLDGEAYRIQTKENQFIILDATSRWRISDPERFYQSLKTLDNAYNRLADIVDSATRTIVAQNRLSEVVRSSNLLNENIITDVSLSDSENQIESLINARTTSEIVTKGRRQLSFEMLEEARKMTDGMEWQANFLSSVLLMPKEAVRIVVASKKQKNPKLRALAMIQAVSKTFDVSPEAAKYRLQELGHIENDMGNVSFLNAGIVFPTA